jgi:hypothetical protein
MIDHRPPATLIGDALGLDFLNSIAAPLDECAGGVPLTHFFSPSARRWRGSSARKSFRV